MVNIIHSYSGCVILTHDNKILLQKREETCKHFPGYTVEFGGRIENNETPTQAIIRELKEELGAKVNENELVYFGAITEDETKHTELIHCYFWHDKMGTITGCYEGKPVYFDSVQSVEKIPKITNGLRWLLKECQKKHFID